MSLNDLLSVWSNTDRKRHKQLPLWLCWRRKDIRVSVVPYFVFLTHCMHVLTNHSKVVPLLQFFLTGNVVVGWCEGVVYLTLPGRPTDIGLQLGKACYPCSR